MARDYFKALDEGKAKAKKKKATKAEKPKVERKPLYIHMRPDLWQRVRNAAYWLSGPPHRLNLTRLTEAALERELKRLEKAENGGEPFPPAEAEPAAGRPSKP